MVGVVSFMKILVYAIEEIEHPKDIPRNHNRKEDKPQFIHRKDGNGCKYYRRNTS